ncbi:Protein sprint [Nymphon striatum]|nr:Protein sprint [Nymphon striatum]
MHAIKPRLCDKYIYDCTKTDKNRYEEPDRRDFKRGRGGQGRWLTAGSTGTAESSATLLSSMSDGRMTADTDSVLSGFFGGGTRKITTGSICSDSSRPETSVGSFTSVSSTCDIGMLERLIRTHPIWYLPGISRTGAVHLLQGKDIGNYIVRQSSKPNTMAISVRLPEGKGPYIEHYLIETAGNGKLRLEGSDHQFTAIPMLVSHYSQCCDELPVRLCLTKTLAEIYNRHELSSLALLGQDYWVSNLTLPRSRTQTLTRHPPPDHPPPQPPSLGKLGTHKSESSSKSTISSNSRHSSFIPSTLSSNDSDLKKQTNSAPPSPAPPPPPIVLRLTSLDQQKLEKRSPSPPPPPPPRNIDLSSKEPPPLPPPRTHLPAKELPLPPPPTTLELSRCLSSESDDSNQRSGSDNTDENNRLNRLSAQLPNLHHGCLRRKNKKVSTPNRDSDLMDSSPPSTICYRSSLVDKISDYEDIWGTTAPRRDSSSDRSESSIQLQLNRLNLLLSLPNEHSTFQYQNLQMPTIQFSKAKIKPERSMSENDNVPSEEKQGVRFSSNPYYAEPVDSLNLPGAPKVPPRKVVGLPKVQNESLKRFSHRNSDPSCQSFELRPPPPPPVQDEDSEALSSSHHQFQSKDKFDEPKEQISRASSSSESVQTITTTVDVKNQGQEQLRIPKQPYHRKSGKTLGETITSWRLDSSWEWLAHGNEFFDYDSDETAPDLPPKTTEAKFPLVDMVSLRSTSSFIHNTDQTTIEDLIMDQAPELKVPVIRPLTEKNLIRMSEYDNLDEDRDSGLTTRPVSSQTNVDLNDDAATEFSEPWDSSRWENLLLVAPQDDNGNRAYYDQPKSSRNELKPPPYLPPKPESMVPSRLSAGKGRKKDVGTDFNKHLSGETALSDDESATISQMALVKARDRAKSFQERIDPLLSLPRLVALRNNEKDSCDKLQQYIICLSQDKSTTFGMAIENFIQCTQESTESNPHIVMRNVRQFMSGIKNYLVTHGEGQFEDLVMRERSKLKANKFLNIDAIIEGALHKLVIKPLKKFIYQCFVNEYTKNDALKLLSENIKYARTKTPGEIGIKPEFIPPHGASIEVIRHFLTKLQQVYSPLKKLENLLAAISTIYNSIFLPLFIYVLVHCGMIAAEIEADYMWGLLHPSLLTGEGGYYLTTLSSAVHILKNFKLCHEEKNVFTRSPGGLYSCSQNRIPCISDLQGFMKIMIPDELNGSIISKTLPVRPNMTTREVCKMIAHKHRITNPQDYGLYQLVGGEEKQLEDGICPQAIKEQVQNSGQDCVFVYKRCDAKILWPIHTADF